MRVSHAHRFTERHFSRQRIEYKIDCARKHSLDFQNLVARVAQVVYGADDRQTGTNVGFEQILHIALVGNVLEAVVRSIVRGGSNLVGSHHVDVMVEQLAIYAGNVGTRCAIHKHRIENVHFQNLRLDVLCRGGNSSPFEQSRHVANVEAIAVEYALLRVGNAHHAQLKRLFALKALLLLVNLIYKAHSHVANAGDKQVKHLRFRQEKTVVNNIERLAQISQINHKRDVGFRRTLRTSNHIDAVTTQRVEQLAGNTRSVLHVLAHNSHGGKVALSRDVADVARAKLVHKLLSQHLHCLFGIGILHSKRGVVLR